MRDLDSGWRYGAYKLDLYHHEFTRRALPDLDDPPTLRLILEIIREQPGWEFAGIHQSALGVWIIFQCLSTASQAWRAQSESDALFEAMNACLREKPRATAEEDAGEE